MVNQYIQENKDRFLSELMELLKLPSVSADPKFDADVKAKLQAEIQEQIQSQAAATIEEAIRRESGLISKDMLVDSKDSAEVQEENTPENLVEKELAENLLKTTD